MSKPLTDEDGEVRELTAEDMHRFRPIQEVDPGMLEAIAESRRRGRPPLAAPKVHMSLRLGADVVAGIRSTGPGYNVWVEKVLRDALAKGEL